MARKSSAPERSCIGCAVRREKKELVRFACKDKVLVPDVSGLVDGRGTYLCYDKECFARAVNKNAFSRAFKRHIKLPGTDAVLQGDKRLLEAAGEYLWKVVTEGLAETGKIKEVKLKG